jgi:hypothetical protein
LRLTVIIDAPQEAINRVIHQHTMIKQLLDTGWIYLWRFDQEQLLQYRLGEWCPLKWSADYRP